MIVILEGPDRVGKTTQAKLLAERLYTNYWNHPTQFFHFSQTGNRKMTELVYRDMLETMASRPNTNYILDRFLIGEAVYAPLYRGYSGDWVYGLEEEYRDLLDEAYLIHLWDKPENLVDREDGESLGQSYFDKLHELDAYRRAVEDSNIGNKVTISVTCKTPACLHKEICHYIGEQ